VAIAAWCADCRAGAFADSPNQLHEFFEAHLHSQQSVLVGVPRPRQRSPHSRQLVLPLAR